MDKEKEIKKLRTQKAKARRQGHLRLVAEYANSIGNLCSAIGDYKQAIEEHETELSICQDLKDIEGEAIACRKLGECYIELIQLEPAKQYINNYVELARTLPNNLELQRAYVTLGRLCLVEIPTLTPGTSKRKQSEKKAESAFMKALEWADKLKSNLQASEFQQMRARAILNLGLLADLKGELKEAIANFTNAAFISRKHGLYDTLVTSLNNKAEILARQAEFSEARANIEEALGYGKKVDLEQMISVVRLFAQVTVEMGDVGVGLDTIKPVIRGVSETRERDELTQVAIKLYKIILAKRKIPLVNDDEKRKIFEKIGDYCCSLGALHHALLSYQKTLDIINKLKMGYDILTPILISMARTYQDLKKYDQAINYYCQEAKIQQQLNNFDQAARSLLNVAMCMENGSTNLQMVQQCYKKAENHARNAKDPKLQLLVLSNCRDSMRALGCVEVEEDCVRKIEQLKSEHGIDAESQESQVSEMDDGSDSSDGGFELSDHSSDEEHETEVVKSTRCRPFKLSRNETGETKLHQAVIKGKKDVVKDLLNKGHPVDVRDHAGWLPIHEAAIHNQVEIAKLLVDYGSDVNDRAGKEGITPLHDACSSGCTEMLQFLMESGASVIAKDNENLYPLDHLLLYFDRAYADLNHTELEELEELESMLRRAMMRKGITPKRKPFKEELQLKEDDIASEMPVIGKSSKSPVGSDDEVEGLDGDVLGPAMSPPVSATEMYRSAVANVRKSAKRVALPQAANTHTDGAAAGPSLLPEDCDDNLQSTGDWLVNDQVSSPAKKKQRVSRQRTRSAKVIERYSRQSTPSVVDESPAKIRPCSPEDAGTNSPTYTSQQSPVHQQSPVNQQSPVHQQSPVNQQSPVHQQSLVIQQSPVHQQSLVNQQSPVSQQSPVNQQSPVSQQSPVNQLSPVEELQASKRQMRYTRANNGEENEDCRLLSHPSPIMEMDVNASQPLTPAFNTASGQLEDNMREGAESETVVKDLRDLLEQATPPVEDKENKSGPLHGDTQLGMQTRDRSKPKNPLSGDAMEDQPKGTHTSPQPASQEATDLYWNQQPPSPDVSFIHTTSTASSAVVSESAVARRTRLSTDSKSKLPANGSGRQLPTSTPLRKSIPSQRGNCVNTPTSKDHLLTVNSRPNSEREPFIVPRPTLRPLENVLNGSIITDSGSTFSHFTSTDLNSSYLQNIRVIVEWRERTMLIPIPKSEMRSIGWLTDEVLRRMSRRSSQPVPESSDVFLTRASDGAELFSEDAVLDLLVDNERVIMIRDEDYQ